MNRRLTTAQERMSKLLTTAQERMSKLLTTAPKSTMISISSKNSRDLRYRTRAVTQLPRGQVQGCGSLLEVAEASLEQMKINCNR